MLYNSGRFAHNSCNLRGVQSTLFAISTIYFVHNSYNLQGGIEIMLKDRTTFRLFVLLGVLIFTLFALVGCYNPDDNEIVTDRYVTVVDVGGRSTKADYSVILVLDRLFMAEGGKPVVVAQWYGHIDIDLLAWKAAQIAAFYDNSLLVIESNTLETHDKERQVDGDQSQFILNQIKDIYPNLYARKQSEEAIREGMPKNYGFHTNIATKPMIITTLVKVIRENLYIERDARCLDEYLCYEKKQNGAFGAIAGKHDDLLMTRAIGLHICFFEMNIPRFIPRINRVLPKKKKAISAATI